MDGVWVTGGDGLAVDVEPFDTTYYVNDVGQQGPEPSIGVTSSGCSVDLVPVAASCVRCHQTRAGGSGNALAREMSRNGRPDTAARIVVERKWNDEGFARLAEALVEHRTTPVVVGPTARHER